MSDKLLTPDERFEKYISPEPNSGCWLWIGTCASNGYGRFSWKDRRAQAHRYSYERSGGIIPVGMELDHLCRTPLCVNPKHLEPVTRLENILRGSGPAILRARHASVMRCPLGHEYTAENTRVSIGRFRSRHCKTCNKERNRRVRAARREALAEWEAKK